MLSNKQACALLIFALLTTVQFNTLMKDVIVQN